MSDWRLIVNGKAAGSAALRDAVAAHRRAGRRLSVRVTWEFGDAQRYVEEAVRDDVERVIAAGGDGTLGEVAGALAELGDSHARMPDLAVLPLGTANDFATAAGIPTDLDEAFALAGSPAAHVDMLRVHSGHRVRWCLNMATGGFGTQATADAHDGLKKYLGGLTYLLGGLRALRSAEPHPLEVRGPGFRWQGDVLAIAIGNGRQAGGGHPLCPDALIDDGELDVTVVPVQEGGVGGPLRTALTDGREAAIDQAGERARLPWIELLATAPFTLNLDGEPFEGERFRIDCRPAALRLHLPVDCPLRRPMPPPGSAGANRALPRERL
ncbi:lipid kinase YegS [Lysobacter xanthus]